jgi:AcrR family transcriptional regulator
VIGEQAQSDVEATDPRVLRSRRMLMDAFAKLLRERPFEEISVQDIADEATLNRNTFYLHYPDKAALLLAMTELRFRELVKRRSISFTDCNGALRAVALGVCDYLTELTNCPVKGALIPIEGSIIPVVAEMFKEGAEHHRLISGVDPALLATTGAWAVFGAARLWHQTPDRISAEEMATKIEAIVKPLFLHSFQLNETPAKVASPTS